MNVAFVNRELLMNRGGGEINDLNIAKTLRDIGHQVEFFARVPMLKNERHGTSGFVVNKVTSPYLYGVSHSLPGIIASIVRHIDGRLFATALKRVLTNREYDIIQLTGRPSLTSIKRTVNSKVVYSVRGDISDFYLNNIEHADGLIAWGSSITGLQDRGISLPPTIQMTPGVDVDKFKSGGGDTLRSKYQKEDEKIVLFIGRFVDLKNISYLIDEFETLNESSSKKYRLLLVGDGPLRPSLERQASRTNASDRIQFVGQVPHEDVPDYYAAADLFVLPSKSENYPIVLLEAMAAGLPIVAPRVGGVPEIVRNGENGILFEQHDPDILSQCIEKALVEFDTEKVASRNRKRVKGKYSWRARAERIDQFYCELLE